MRNNYIRSAVLLVAVSITGLPAGSSFVGQTPTEAELHTFESGAQLDSVNFSDYGAVGDGVADDTAAIQAALDAEPDLIADPGAEFKISARIDLDQAFAHSIEWNDSRIFTNLNLTEMLRVDKRSANGGVTAMQNLLIDGNGAATGGVRVFSRPDFTNVDAADFVQTKSTSPSGIKLEVYDEAAAHGDWVLNGCDVHELHGDDNGTIGDSVGAANGFLIYWRELPTVQTTITIKNGSSYDSWGEDAQNLAVFSPSIDLGTTTSGLVLENMEFYNWERRSLKLFSANNTVRGGAVADTDTTHPDMSGAQPSAGMVAVGTGSGAAGSSGNVFEDVEFIGRTSNSRDKRVIATNTADISFKRLAFSGGADLAFRGDMGNASVCGSSFGAGSRIYDYGEGADLGEIVLDYGNTGESGYIQLDGFSYVEAALDCPPGCIV